MADEDPALRAKLDAFVGQPLGAAGEGPDPVNVPMIRHWVDALDDRNPLYEDEEAAAEDPDDRRPEHGSTRRQE